MSGIFGVLDSKRSTSVSRLVSRMGSEMSHRNWYVAETYVDEESGIGLGRIGIGIFNREPQPRCNEDQSLIAFLSGKLHKTERIRQELEKKGHLLRDDSDLELALRLYEEKGEKFIHDLEGAFVLGIWDRLREQFLIANDRFGLYPLYYTHYDGKLVFAPEMKGVLCDPDFRRELDFTALAEYVRFQQLLGEKTFFEGLKLLPSASLTRYRPHRDLLDIESYWDFSEISPLPDISFEEAAEEAERRLGEAVGRLTSAPYRIGIYLSGGLDSRTLLGLLAREHIPVSSITYGERGCRDVAYGADLARRASTDHHWFAFEDGRWVEEYADLHLALTEGFHSWIHAHGVSTLTDAKQLMDLNVSGFGGGTVLGGSFTLVEEPVDETALLCRLFAVYNQCHTWPSITEGEEASLYTDSLRSQLRGRAFDSLAYEVARQTADTLCRRAEAFKFANHDFRFIHNFLIFNNSHFENSRPFYDYSVVDLAYALPPSIKQDKRLLRRLINQVAPELAMVPYDKDNQLVTDRHLVRAGHDVIQRAKQWVNRHIHPIFDRRFTLYANYEHYLRNSLKAWGESILFDKRTLDRGIFNPDFLHSLWDRHQSGHERHTIGKIAPIMTYEMMLRRFYD